MQLALGQLQVTLLEKGFAVSSRVQKEPTPEEVAKDELHLDNLRVRRCSYRFIS